MTVPHQILVDFAKRKGLVPFPCFYCANKLATNTYILDEKSIVKGFGVEDNVPQRCMAGVHELDYYGDCSRAMYLSLEHHPTFDNSVFDFLTREYMMEVLETINAYGTVAKSKIIERSRKGYHTREERLNDLYGAELVDVSYNIDTEECYSLTAKGKYLADGVAFLIEEFIIIKESGDSLDGENHQMVFKYIRDNSNLTKRQIYDHFGVDDERNGTDVMIPMVIDDLEKDGYIEPMFDAGFDRICYQTTEKGVRRWLRKRNEC